jgi:hypothetical protein
LWRTIALESCDVATALTLHRTSSHVSQSSRSLELSQFRSIIFQFYDPHLKPAIAQFLTNLRHAQEKQILVRDFDQASKIASQRDGNRMGR